MVIAARNQEQLDAVIAEIKAAGGEAAAVVGDVRKVRGQRALLGAAKSSFAHVSNVALFGWVQRPWIRFSYYRTVVLDSPRKCSILTRGMDIC